MQLSLPLYKIPRVNVPELQRLRVLRRCAGYPCCDLDCHCCCAPPPAVLAPVPTAVAEQVVR